MGVKTTIAVAVVGIILVAVGPPLFALLPDFISSKIKETFILHNDTQPFKIWEEIPVPIHLTFSIFNVTNPDEVANYQAIPIVKETGPFVFREHQKKHVSGYNNEGADNETVIYRNNKVYHFEPELSAYDLSLPVTIINVPLAAIAKILEDILQQRPDIKDFLLMAAIQIMEHYNSTMFVTMPAGQLLFEGHYEPLVKEIIQQAKAFVPDLPIPDVLPNNTFGIMYGKNDTDDGQYEVFTGLGDISKYSIIHTWNNMSSLDFWKTPYCNLINGTDGFQYPPFVEKSDRLFVYQPDVCRSLYLEYQEEMFVQGIKAYKFVLPDSVLASPKVNPDNDCFCLDPRLAIFSGAIEISPCWHGAPIVLSLPHFYQASGCISSMIEGLHPNPEIHETYVAVEPNTGVVIDAARRLQVNVHIYQFADIPIYQRIVNNMTDAIFPVAWLEEGATLDKPTASLMKGLLTTPVLIAKSTLLAVIVLGVFLVIGVVLSVLRPDDSE